uniref:Uncharacterized protein n=1 Tax=Rhopalocnemis phalloides TaxID=1128106 RepID=A0A8K1XMH0_9MAGN|nr:protein of unknown function Ycf2 [Rhopalocnemis phalloides]
MIKIIKKTNLIKYMILNIILNLLQYLIQCLINILIKISILHNFLKIIIKYLIIKYLYLIKYNLLNIQIKLNIIKLNMYIIIIYNYLKLILNNYFSFNYQILILNIYNLKLIFDNYFSFNSQILILNYKYLKLIFDIIIKITLLKFIHKINNKKYQFYFLFNKLYNKLIYLFFYFIKKINKLIYYINVFFYLFYIFIFQYFKIKINNIIFGLKYKLKLKYYKLKYKKIIYLILQYFNFNINNIIFYFIISFIIYLFIKIKLNKTMNFKKILKFIYINKFLEYNEKKILIKFLTYISLNTAFYKKQYLKKYKLKKIGEIFLSYIFNIYKKKLLYTNFNYYIENKIFFSNFNIFIYNLNLNYDNNLNLFIIYKYYNILIIGFIKINQPFIIKYLLLNYNCNFIKFYFFNDNYNCQEYFKNDNLSFDIFLVLKIKLSFLDLNMKNEDGMELKLKKNEFFMKLQLELIQLFSYCIIFVSYLFINKNINNKYIIYKSLLNKYNNLYYNFKKKKHTLITYIDTDTIKKLNPIIISPEKINICIKINKINFSIKKQKVFNILIKSTYKYFINKNKNILISDLNIFEFKINDIFIFINELIILKIIKKISKINNNFINFCFYKISNEYKLLFTDFNYYFIFYKIGKFIFSNKNLNFCNEYLFFNNDKKLFYILKFSFFYKYYFNTNFYYKKILIFIYILNSFAGIFFYLIFNFFFENSKIYFSKFIEKDLYLIHELFKIKLNYYKIKNKKKIIPILWYLLFNFKNKKINYKLFFNKKNFYQKLIKIIQNINLNIKKKYIIFLIKNIFLKILNENYFTNILIHVYKYLLKKILYKKNILLIYQLVKKIIK